MTARIAEFRFDLNPWRLDWLGRLVYPGSSQSEPRIAVYLSRLRPDYDDPLSNSALAEPIHNEIAFVKVGQIALLRIGSVWVDGMAIVPRKAKKERSFTVRHDQFELARFDSSVTIGGELEPMLSAFRYRIGGRASNEVAGTWLAVAYEPTPGVEFIAIPSVLLFQKSLATSPKAVRRLVYGEIDKIVDPDCGFVEDEPDTFYVNLFQDFRDSEAKAIANLKADPVGQRQFQRFRNTVVVASANHDQGKLGDAPAIHIKLGLPFSNPVQLTLIGKGLRFDRMQGNSKVTLWGFLATEIVELKTRLVFSRLAIDRKNDATKGKNSDDPNLPTTSWGAIVKTPIEASDPLPVASNTEPADDLEKASIEARGDFDAIDLVILDRIKDVQKFRAMPLRRPDAGAFNGTGTTGAPGSDLSGVVEVDIPANQTPRIPATLDQFFEALHLLSMQGIVFETLAVTERHRVRQRDRHVVNFFPTRIKPLRSWHLMSKSEPGRTRGYVVAEVHRGGVWHYIVEIEHKRPGELGLLHIQALAGTRIEHRRFAWLMTDIAVANGLSGADTYGHIWRCRSFHHTPAQGAAGLARSISNAM